jgi:3-oxoacyl-[acyl-carrier-protein] synthase II
MKRRVVVTGIGAISPIGNDAKTMWSNAKKGVNGIDYIKGFDTANLPVKIGGEVRGVNFTEILDRKLVKRYDRFVQYGLVSTKEAVTDSGLNFETENTDRFGVYFGSGIGGLETIAAEEDKGQEKGFDRLSPFFIPGAIINIAAGQIAIDHGITGIVTATVTACASATNSIGEAFRAIRDGYLDGAIAGGSEASLIPLGMGGFYVMQALNKSNDPNNASMPFDKDRSGFVMGEGSGTLVLEEYERAVARGANIYAEIVGYGATCDASHVTAPDPEGTGAKKCMEMAVSDAGLELTDVDYINAHGTSTPMNDKTETLAIKRAFGEHAYNLNVSSTKSMTGHLLGASGAIEAIFALMATKEDVVPPTITTKVLDELCDLNYTLGKSVNREVDVAISNSLGFGGHNATIAFKKYRG